MAQSNERPPALARHTAPLDRKAPPSGLPPLQSSQSSGSDLRSPRVGILTNGESKDAAQSVGSAVRTPTTPPPSRSKGRADTGLATPPGRRSVQFARSPLGAEWATTDDEAGPSRRPGADSGRETGDEAGRDPKEAKETAIREWKASSLFSRLRSYAGSPPAHRRRPSDYTIRSEPGEGRPQLTPGSESGNQLSDHGFEYESDEEDADSEGSASSHSDSDAPRHQRRRPRRRPRPPEASTAPTTPRSLRPNFFSHTSSMFGRERRPGMVTRRSTTGMTAGDDRLGVSEDEGRRRSEVASDFRRRARGLRSATFVGRRERNDNDGTPRPRAIRRALTAVAGGDREDNPLSPFPRRRERLREKIADLRARRKARKPPTADQIKSAELVAELSAGVPAALILASMFQTDDRGHKRIPVLLEQLKVRLVKVEEDEEKAQERHPSFHIQLEYGNGLTRMTWTIDRTLSDLYKLHFKYRTWANAQKVVQLRSSDKRIKLPHFPNRAFPYARGLRGFQKFEDSDSEPETTKNEKSNGKQKEPATLQAPDPIQEKPASSGGPSREAERSPRPDLLDRAHQRPRPSPGFLRRKSSMGEALGSATQKSWAEQQREMLERYLQDMIRFLMFRPQNSRLCKFFELSALGIRLAAEGSYHGKEGPLAIQSGGSDFRRGIRNIGSHLPKWFMVRHSYIACVDSPEEISVYDVLMLDSDFEFVSKKWRPSKNQKHVAGDIAIAMGDSATFQQKHRLKLKNSERRMNLLAKNSRLAGQFEASLRHVMETSPWTKKQRFDSFAPVRNNVFAQWLVDGRDHMWNASRAISMAKDSIYIHDWWLSPELYMRRPAAISREWRLDRLLKRKAEEGVRVFVIVYRNVESAIPIDSTYTKACLLGLHRNIQVQRSPNQMRQGTFFWAHHEKLLIVDHTIAFVGGVDLCFGRWDTPAHEITDNKLTGFENDDMPKDAEHCQLWPGKDYSNPRVQDFFNLSQPYEEMYNRSQVPRMPWHDISMQLIGQPARDLTRHFVQRWNYILRQRKPSRPTPFLLPPPELEEKELEELGITGTCEVQLLRSCGMWSIGTPDRVEHSIMTAYVKLIQESEHFVYIENQFFITSTRALGERIENTVGDALVERIIRAYRNDEAWRAVIIIPLMPGFQNTVDSQDGTSIRLIMLCQYRSICRGENSIFARLRKEGIDPEDYIQFYALRSWGKLGANQALMTEQLYIHAKCMIVDDRAVIIGSANINERSMLGDRDSEVAAIVRDTDMLWSTMDGKPFEVGRFAHTLRIRLMREHLGIDVDAVALEELGAEQDEQWAQEMDEMYAGSASDASQSESEAESLTAKSDEEAAGLDAGALLRPPYVENHRRERELTKSRSADLNENRPPSGRARRATVGTALSGKHSASGGHGSDAAKADAGNFALPPTKLFRANTYDLGLPLLSQLPALPVTDDADICGPAIQRTFSQRSAMVGLGPQITNMKCPVVTQDCMRDPLSEEFYDAIWHRVAENNTVLFRKVFRCMPDNEVRTWADYKEYNAYYERFQRSQGASLPDEQPNPDPAPVSGPPGAAIAAERMQAEALKHGDRLGSSGRSDSQLSRPSSQATEKPSVATDSALDVRHPPPPPVQMTPPTPSTWSAPARDDAPHQSATHLSPVPSQQGLSGRPHAGSLTGSMEGTVAPSSLGASSSTTAVNTSAQLGGNLAAGITTGGGSQRRRRRARTTGSAAGEASGESRRGHHHHAHRRPDELLPRDVAEEVLSMVQGHLIVWPYDWLLKEEENDNWMYTVDAIAPLEIYN